MGKITIGYVSAVDPFCDRRAWSGLVYKIREAIENAGFEVCWIPYKNESFAISVLQIFFRLMRLITGQKYLVGVHNRFFCHQYSKHIDINIVNRCDYVFFSGGAQISLFLNTKVPIIYYTDATVYGMIDYYWKGFSKKSIEEAKVLEFKAAHHCAINIRASQWAIDSVVNDCKGNPSNCYVLEFGANIDSNDIVPIVPYHKGIMNVLFSGVDWGRKGGKIAVETVRLLREKGVDSHLIVVGPKSLPQECKGIGYVEFVGFLNKNDSGDYKKYIELYKKSHIFLLPTIAECAGVVFSEASSFGIPSYTYATGGTTNYVLDNVNGRALELDKDARHFAEAIYDDIVNKRFSAYKENCLRISKEKLSWEAWSNRFKEIMRNRY